MNCPKCDGEVQSGWVACPACGEKLPQKVTCAKCEQELQSDWKVCPFCGQAVGGETAQPQRMAAEDVVAKEFHQTQMTDDRAAGGANIGGGIHFSLGGSSRDMSNAEVDYESYVLMVLRAGGRLDGVRTELESRRQRLGLSLRIANEIEAACVRAVGPKEPEPASEPAAKTPPTPEVVKTQPMPGPPEPAPKPPPRKAEPTPEAAPTAIAPGDDPGRAERRRDARAALDRTDWMKSATIIDYLAEVTTFSTNDATAVVDGFWEYVVDRRHYNRWSPFLVIPHFGSFRLVDRRLGGWALTFHSRRTDEIRSHRSRASGPESNMWIKHYLTGRQRDEDLSVKRRMVCFIARRFKLDLFVAQELLWELLDLLLHVFEGRRQTLAWATRGVMFPVPARAGRGRQLLGWGRKKKLPMGRFYKFRCYPSFRAQLR